MDAIRIIMKLLQFIDDGNFREAEEMFQLLWKIKELDKFNNPDIYITK